MAVSPRRIAVAMSGGVDSSVAAALLKEWNHDVVGLTMRLYAGPCHDPCEEDASKIARELGIPHHVADLAAVFEDRTVGYFAAEYARGLTPNPCVLCNRLIKFGALFDVARSLGATHLATGHYARIAKRAGRLAIRQGVDTGKDQSYVLAALSQEQLERAVFPLGEHTKSEVRAIADKLGLTAVDRPESQDICFVEDGDYRRFLEERGVGGKPGPVVTQNGTVLGTHQGLHRYTVGQRKGLGIAGPAPYYVLRLDSTRNAVVVGHAEDTCASGLVMGDVVWSGRKRASQPFPCLAKIRYNHTPVAAVAQAEDEWVRVRFNEPESSIAPGQWCVLYEEDTISVAGTILPPVESG